MKKKIPAVLCSGLLILSIAACSGSKPNTVSNATPSAPLSASPSDSLSQTVFTGKVTAIEGSRVTLALATKDSASPATPNVSASTSGGQTLGKDNQTPGNSIQDQNAADIMKDYTLTGETKTIVISSDTIITSDFDGQKVTGTISDIAVDDLLTVTMTGSTVSAITVSNAITPPPMTDESNADATSSPTGSPSTTHTSNAAI